MSNEKLMNEMRKHFKELGIDMKPEDAIELSISVLSVIKYYTEKNEPYATIDIDTLFNALQLLCVYAE